MVDFLDDIWDIITEGVSYIFSFEWGSDLMEFFGAMFDGLNELSITGTILGLLGAGLIFYIETQTTFGTISAFTKFMPPLQRWFWTVATYVGCFVGGYLVGKGFDNTG